ncbi:PIG-L deacetylase family protein [Tomitella fengzijianii]|uniref:PIG-L family deacetylase n=1 Tax=Tomitella fengzijianii TaxID=2597660 RepID=A0A516X0V2_9ACTN|nr:PIG-L family deacetylase [Tomitella fengzijianii]QDQ96660.1 PIG-L family deacetylase [Tomitella fengzijianii]
MITLGAGAPREVAVLGAHCDDIGIGAGGTLLTLAAGTENAAGHGRAPLRVRALVLCGAGTVRAEEERAALEALCPGADVGLTVLDLPDGHTPAHWGAVKSAVARFAAATRPDIVFAPQRDDAHQDHRLLAAIVPTEFRDHLVLGYEVLKWEADTPRPAAYQPLTPEQAKDKARILFESYPSQHGRDWFDESAFLALSRLRGVQCRAVHAEAFTIDKAIVDLAAGPRPASPSEE